MFRRSDIYQRPITVVGLKQSVALVEGPTWSTQRKVFSPSFSKMNVNNMLDDIYKESESFCEYLLTKSLKSQPVDMLHASTYYGCKVLGRVALGISDESNYFFSHQYIDDLSDMLQYISQRMLFPLPQFIWRYTSKYSYEVKASQAAQRFRDCANEVIASGKQDNFVGQLLKAVDSNKFTLDEVISNVLVVAMAGTDPVAVGLCWAMYFLSQDPVVVEDIRKEISSLDKSLSSSDRYNGLKLCQACYMEAIRLRGPAFHIDLQAIDKTIPITLQSGTIIRPNDNILIPLEAIKTNPNVFNQPNEFNPYRWFEQDKVKLAEMQQYCLTFGFGPRICPGYEIAPAMGALALASIIDHFDVELACPKDEIYRIVAFTVTMNKMPFKLTPHKHGASLASE